MNRKEFLSLILISAVDGFVLNPLAIAAEGAKQEKSGMQTDMDVKPQTLVFKDDGKIPNNILPLLLYQNAFSEEGAAGAESLEKRFAENNWTNSWRNGIFSFQHYHSNTHEVLGIYSGSATVQLGGEKGEKVKVKAGDIIVIPAGVGHENLGSSADFGVVGAYPDGKNPDLMRGEPGERPQIVKNIAAVPLPENDPLQGRTSGLREIWK